MGDRAAPPVYSRPSLPASAAAAAAAAQRSASHQPGSQRTTWAGEGRGVTVHDHSVLKGGICACSGTEAFVPTGNLEHHAPPVGKGIPPKNTWTGGKVMCQI